MMNIGNRFAPSSRTNPFLLIALCAIIVIIMFGLANVAVPRAFAAPKNIYVSTTGNDSNNGQTPGQPFKTITTASLAAAPGDTVHVAVGNYTDSSIVTAANGEPGKRIRYVSDIAPDGSRAKLIPPENNPNQVVWENKGNYVDIVGFEVVGIDSTSKSDSPTNVGIYTTGTNTTIQNNIVHDIATTSVCSNQGGAGILSDWAERGENTKILGNTVYNVGFYECGTYIHGIYFATTGTVSNNLVYHVGGGAVHLEHDARNVTISNNTLVDSGAGVIIAQGVSEHYHPCSTSVTTNCYSGPADYIHVSNNIIYDNKDYGVIEINDTGTHNTFTNNLVYQNNQNWSLQNGLTHSGTISSCAPNFVNYSAKNFHLLSNSQAIDHGSATYAPNTDFDGNSRPQGSGYDIGAYEYVPGPNAKTLTFWHLDNRGPADLSGYWYKQALVNGTVVWEKDLAASGESAGAWYQESVNITS